MNPLNVRESAKLAIRKKLSRLNIGLERDPSICRLARTLNALGVACVLDVGANVGQFAALLRSAGYAGVIESYEPEPTAYKHLARRSGKDPAWRPHSLALGARPSVEKLNVSKNSYSSSLLEVNETHLRAAPRSETISNVEVEVIDLDGLAKKMKWSPDRTFVKLDTQGYEGEIICGGRDFLRQVAGVQVEMSLVPLYRGQPLFDEIRTAMADLGLALYSIAPGISDHTGRMLQCDGVFVRDSALKTVSEAAIDVRTTH